MLRNIKLLVSIGVLLGGVLNFSASKAQEISSSTNCSTVSLDSDSKYVGFGEDNWSVTVTTADETCAWSAASDADWLVVRSTIPDPAVGSGTVKLRALANADAGRVAHVSIADQTYTVTQEPLCPSGKDSLIVAGDRGSGQAFTIDVDAKTVTATFQLKDGCQNRTISVITFTIDDPPNKYPQTLFKQSSDIFNGDGVSHTLTVALPDNCQYQIDLLSGTFTDTTLNADNDLVLGPKVADFIKNFTVCAPPPPPPAPSPPPPPPSGGGGGGITPPPAVAVTPPPLDVGGGEEVVVIPPAPEGQVLGITTPEETPLDVGGVSEVPLGGVAAGEKPLNTLPLGLLLMFIGIAGIIGTHNLKNNQLS